MENERQQTNQALRTVATQERERTQRATQERERTQRATQERERTQRATKQKDGIAKKEESPWSRTALDRQQWGALLEGYLPQWMDNALREGEMKVKATPPPPPPPPPPWLSKTDTWDYRRELESYTLKVLRYEILRVVLEDRGRERGGVGGGGVKTSTGTRTLHPKP